jgi:hypothetical protein
LDYWGDRRFAAADMFRNFISLLKKGTGSERSLDFVANFGLL